MEFGFNSLSSLAIIKKKVKRKRLSSYDQTGSNADFVIITEQKKVEICNLKSSGIIKHIWMTLASSDPYYLRKVLIRMWWDDEKDPSVECPIGDFFGVGHGKTVTIIYGSSRW